MTAHFNVRNIMTRQHYLSTILTVIHGTAAPTTAVSEWEATWLVINNEFPLNPILVTISVILTEHLW